MATIKEEEGVNLSSVLVLPDSLCASTFAKMDEGILVEASFSWEGYRFPCEHSKNNLYASVELSENK
ncbi:MAG: hypothetical protein JKY51_05265, partial [Opitutaceae bacterium]|nr:hypothetical protein [Opitutaceae bacterium]